jgi:hypothetical protein
MRRGEEYRFKASINPFVRAARNRENLIGDLTGKSLVFGGKLL